MLDEIKKIRLEKLEAIKKAGFNPYPAKTSRTHSAARALADFSSISEPLKKIVLAGRLRSFRQHGGSTFAHLEDGSGSIQLYFKKDKVGADRYAFFLENFDIGDFIEASGVLFKTKKEEITLEVEDFRMLAKSLLPLPEKWHGLTDPEERLRKRYLDLIMGPEVRKTFIKKGVFWKSLRSVLHEHDFLEVDTPALESVPGGADAEPFVTHYNALDQDVYLRISLELPLKKLIVGGFEKVFEIGKIFRNEGISAEHLQDYLQLEFYWAYADYETLMEFVEEMYKRMIREVTGGLTTTFKGQTIEWGGAWPRLDYFELFKKEIGVDLETQSRDDLFALAQRTDLAPEPHLGWGRLVDLIFKKQIRPKLIQPVFLVNPPVEIEPLAKRLEENSSKAQRVQVVACGTELGKGFSELNDPNDQRERFEEQVKLREQGDKEAQRLDEDFLTALEYGMPPCAGFGLSERLFAVLMDKPVRETVFFPAMKPKT